MSGSTIPCRGDEIVEPGGDVAAVGIGRWPEWAAVAVAEKGIWRGRYRSRRGSGVDTFSATKGFAIFCGSIILV
jgi:hypothetical protein